MGLTAPLPWQVMKTMARKCTRARYYSPEYMREEYVRTAFEYVDWDETEEVTTLYIAKDLVHWRRAADELWLEWGDVERVEATSSTTGGQVGEWPSNLRRVVLGGGVACSGRRARGLTPRGCSMPQVFRYSWTKNNPEGRDKPTKGGVFAH